MQLSEALKQLKISVDFIPKGAPMRPGTKLQPTFITIHNTGNSKPNANAKMHAVFVKSKENTRNVSWHFTVDDKETIKHLPTNEVANHAVAGNSKSIGIEVCMHKGINQAKANERASLLAAVLMDFYNIPVERVVTHQFWTGKDCPFVILRQPGEFGAFRDQAADFLNQLQAELPVREAMAALDEVELESLPDSLEAVLAPAVSPQDLIGQALTETPEDRLADLERLAGRLAAENERLRRLLRELQSSFIEAE